jgi:hypothetical protein
MLKIYLNLLLQMNADAPAVHGGYGLTGTFKTHQLPTNPTDSALHDILTATGASHPRIHHGRNRELKPTLSNLEHSIDWYIKVFQRHIVKKLHHACVLYFSGVPFFFSTTSSSHSPYASG